ncbi:hypothetical protein AMTR_s00008p00189260 [Amborella trichopoda]|uniref:Uncharacterized protein n=1 Tax=Amborella trichopoda TaxID=13333 RepID=W1NHU6_AMBTC|nr:hypothetical protein AMTR_s00008p00189260 [Amborella trichopoda]
MPSQAATPQNLPRGLVLASSSSIPPILVAESSFETEDLSARSCNWSQKPHNKMEVMGKKDKMLKAGNLEFTGEIVVVEECILVGDLNWNQALQRRRP